MEEQSLLPPASKLETGAEIMCMNNFVNSLNIAAYNTALENYED